MNEGTMRDSAASADQACGSKWMIATCGSLSRYLGNIICVDAKQGKRIEEMLRDILAQMEQIRRELHRIGIN